MRKPSLSSLGLTEEECEAFKKLLSKNETLIELLQKIIDNRSAGLGVREDLLKEVTYPQRRAFLDGREKELLWFTSILELGD